MDSWIPSTQRANLTKYSLKCLSEMPQRPSCRWLRIKSIKTPSRKIKRWIFTATTDFHHKLTLREAVSLCRWCTLSWMSILSILVRRKCNFKRYVRQSERVAAKLAVQCYLHCGFGKIKSIGQIQRPYWKPQTMLNKNGRRIEVKEGKGNRVNHAKSRSRLKVTSVGELNISIGNVFYEMGSRTEKAAFLRSKLKTAVSNLKSCLRRSRSAGASKNSAWGNWRRPWNML